MKVLVAYASRHGATQGIAERIARPKEFAEFDRAIHPRDEHVFVGAYDPDAPSTGRDERLMKGFMKLIPAIRSAMPAGDFRDWPAIKAWAKGTARELTPAPH